MSAFVCGVNFSCKIPKRERERESARGDAKYVIRKREDIFQSVFVRERERERGGEREKERGDTKDVIRKREDICQTVSQRERERESEREGEREREKEGMQKTLFEKKKTFSKLC